MVQANWDGATPDDARQSYDNPIREEAARILKTDMNPKPRIRGLKSVSECRHWIAVATDQEPVNRDVIAAINKRIAVLREDDDDDDGDDDGDDGSV